MGTATVAMQPASLREQAAMLAGKAITKEELAKLKEIYPIDLYNEIAKRALPRIAISSKNIWQAVEEIKKLSNSTLNADSELAGQLITALADRYKVDLAKAWHLQQTKGLVANPYSESWELIRGAEIFHFMPETYKVFAALILDTPGTRELAS